MKVFYNSDSFIPRRDRTAGVFMKVFGGPPGGGVITGGGVRYDEWCKLVIDGGTLRIGAETRIGSFAIIQAKCDLTIGARVRIAPGVHIWTETDDFRGEPGQHVAAPVVIGDDVILGSHVVVLPGSVIEDGATVGAGSLVKGRLGPWAVYAGTPARWLGDRRHVVAA